MGVGYTGYFVGMSGGMSYWGLFGEICHECPGELSLQIPMQNYKSVHAVVIICVTLFMHRHNTGTQTPYRNKKLIRR